MSNEQKMKDFINALLKEYYPDLGDIDGGTFQDIAEQHGILIAEIRHQPCGEFCNCNEVVYDEEWLEGVKCFRPANWLSAQQSVHLTCGSVRPYKHFTQIESGCAIWHCPHHTQVTQNR